jgi:hypothetical protein
MVFRIHQRDLPKERRDLPVDMLDLHVSSLSQRLKHRSFSSPLCPTKAQAAEIAVKRLTRPI